MARMQDYEKAYHAVTLPVIQAIGLGVASLADGFKIIGQSDTCVVIEWMHVGSGTDGEAFKRPMVSKITIETAPR
jgi:hypothetical protein